ncbi:hypothetical protein QL996_03935 [Planococcus sp. APC 4015]|nr:hypothetical protein [Planococcus sp. APC 4015]
MSLSRKRKKELRKLQSQANALWESQQVLVGEAGNVAREASRQLGYFGREQVGPRVQHTYEQYAAPVVDRSVKVSRTAFEKGIVPTAGVVVGSALSAWDAANETRQRLAAGRGFSLPDAGKFSKNADKYAKTVSKRLSAAVPAPQKQGIGAGGVIAIVLGVVAAAGVLYAAWQTLRADDELWVADDPLSAPDA